MPPSFDPISRGRATFPHFNPAVAVKLDLDIRKTLTSATRTFTLSVQLQSDHERIVIVGPSGSGKSLTLQARKCGEQTGLDTLVVHTVNDGY